ncbi:MotA/TolQ/ExbB proton channel family protein [Sphingomonas sp. JC676]|uniref:motility protein A n=1 Tax=Sphingomonas sp. JC676 TaxID=2768065 RepID=UPI00165792D5|nr:MotA/TolQ/ExbB proton channel family protein [Sphingomonas sp. JC676]MBC9034494.1 MotA/TolQ/ExbB proton channel family protein [Sphingomonas sp. JC676]
MDFASFPGLAPFIDPLAFAIVGGGTALVVVLRTPVRDLVRGFAALSVLPRRAFRAEPLLDQIGALTRIARRHGVIALDRSVISDPDVAAAVAAAVDGATPETIELLAEQHRSARLERHRAACEVWSGAAEIAPAMGMVGTLIGLVQMFSSMRDTSAIGGAMAVALLTTLYGALLANLVALPIATRLKRRARHEALERARLAAPLAALGAIEPAARRDLHEIAA